jgi:hypothetical protein
VGRAAYAIDWLGMGRSSRPDPKELVSGRRASAKERVEKVSLESEGLCRVCSGGDNVIDWGVATLSGGEVLYGFAG